MTNLFDLAGYAEKRKQWSSPTFTKKTVLERCLKRETDPTRREIFSRKISALRLTEALSDD
jgi:hypothetical protein